VIDPAGLRSRVCKVSVLVDFVPLAIRYKENTNLTTDEDVQISFLVDRYGTDYFDGNVGLTDVNITVSNVAFKGTGTFQICQDASDNHCVYVTAGQTVTVSPHSTFKFQGGPDENGKDALTFVLTLTPLTGAPPLVVPYSVTVIPVNDPPVIIPGFKLADAGETNECDEDTHFVVRFNGTDIDSPISSLKGTLFPLGTTGVTGKFYLCNGNSSAKLYDDCRVGTEIKQGEFASLAGLPGQFSIVFVPAPNSNGKIRVLVQVVDDGFAFSQRQVVEINVLPINDPPAFQLVEYEVVKDKNGSDVFIIGTMVNDTDFKFGRTMEVTYTIVSPDGERAFAGGHFDLPSSSDKGSKANCTVASDGLSITCTDKIEKLNKDLSDGIYLVPDEGVSDLQIKLVVNDLGNIDKLNRPLNASITIDLHNNVTALVVVAAPTTDNVALIAAPIAGVLAGALIAGIIFALRQKAAKAAVENYFDKFALGMEGMTQASPLYVEAKKGGESPIYKNSSSGSPLQ